MPEFTAMSNDQQEWLALVIVFFVVGSFVIRWFRRRSQAESGCAHCEQSSCTSSVKTPESKE
ncbi:MAG: hypothetical protein KUG80_08350 [Gammaproteobacteria bacterium]|nr:hypothetical protein [Gammaproteobacteria bacterium]